MSEGAQAQGGAASAAGNPNLQPPTEKELILIRMQCLQQVVKFAEAVGDEYDWSDGQLIKLSQEVFDFATGKRVDG